MKRALHMILGASLSATAFSGVLIYRQIASASGRALWGVAANSSRFTYLMCIYGFVVEVLVAALAIVGLVAASRSMRRQLDLAPPSRRLVQVRVVANRAYPPERRRARSTSFGYPQSTRD